MGFSNFPDTVALNIASINAATRLIQMQRIMAQLLLQGWPQ